MNRHVVVALSSTALVLSLQGVATPAHADGWDQVGWCFLGMCDTAEIRVYGGYQADGTGQYIDKVRISCVGNFEKSPAMDGYDLWVYVFKRKGIQKYLFHDTNPDVQRNSSDSGCSRTWELGGTLYGRRIKAEWLGKARRDNAKDKTIDLNAFPVGGAQ